MQVLPGFGSAAHSNPPFLIHPRQWRRTSWIPYQHDCQPNSPQEGRVLYLELSRPSVRIVARGFLRPADRRFATKVRYSSLVVLRSSLAVQSIAQQYFAMFWPTRRSWFDAPGTPANLRRFRQSLYPDRRTSSPSKSHAQRLIRLNARQSARRDQWTCLLISRLVR